jgi:excisionase family DNA binding protein
LRSRVDVSPAATTRGVLFCGRAADAIGGLHHQGFAVRWQVSTRTVERWLRDGKLEFTRTPGGQPRILDVKRTTTP